jgi:hypothetical protein
MKKSGLLVTLLVLSCSSVTFAQTFTPESSLTAFIKFSRSKQQVFNHKGIEIQKRYFTDSLYKLFLNELKRQDEYLKKNPSDKPFFGDGVPFLPSDETCWVGKRAYRYTYTVGKGLVARNLATMPVSFVYPKACNIRLTVYKFTLVKGKSGWLINDVDYGDGNTLVANLNRAEY